MSTDLKGITGEQDLALPEEEKLRVMTEIYRELFHQDVTDWSQAAVNVLEDLGINDEESYHSRLEIPLAFLRTCSVMLKYAFTEQNRQELQVLTEDTQFGADLSGAIYDDADAVVKIVEDIITHQTYYHAVLMHRKESKTHLINEDGDTKPFTPEEIKRGELIEAQQTGAWRDNIRKQRELLSDVYWGRAELPELPEGYTHSQGILPMWEAGYAVV